MEMQDAEEDVEMGMYSTSGETERRMESRDFAGTKQSIIRNMQSSHSNIQLGKQKVDWNPSKPVSNFDNNASASTFEFAAQDDESGRVAKEKNRKIESENWSTTSGNIPTWGSSKTPSAENFQNSNPWRSIFHPSSKESASKFNGRSSPSLVVKPREEEAKYMDIEMYQAATKNDVVAFNDVLKKVCGRKNLTVSDILQSVSPSSNTLLHVAASHGNADIVTMLTGDDYPDILKKTNSKGDTALHVAAKAGHNTIVETLIQQINKRKELIHDQTKNQHLSSGQDSCPVRIPNKQGNTALHEALINGHEPVAQSLLKGDSEVVFFLNKKGESPLYLAAEAGYMSCIRTMLESRPRSGTGDPLSNAEVLAKSLNHTAVLNAANKKRKTGNPNHNQISSSAFARNAVLNSKSPIHAAVVNAATNRRETDILKYMLKMVPPIIDLRDDAGRTALHCAACLGYVEAVKFFLGENDHIATQRDNNGFFPLHIAAIKGHVDVIRELLKFCPDPAEMLTYNEQNILHVAAKNGRVKVVRYVLETSELGSSINQKDKNGNTPLHLATLHWHPKVVSVLIWDKRVDLKLTNNEGFTALDASYAYIGEMPSFRKRLTCMALKESGAPRAPRWNVIEESEEIYTKNDQRQPPKIDGVKDRVNTLILVATLVATVTFAAGFTMPGGYNSDLDKGMATMLRRSMFHMFIFCDTIAMYSSITVVVALIWGQLDDLRLSVNALKLSMPLLGVAIASMSLTFMSGVYIVVSRLNWLANAVLIVGSLFLVVLFMLFYPLFPKVSSRHVILRYLFYYTFCLLLFATGNGNTANY
ncbi:hypothetical protein HS088_TW06G00128 [Tripterygium wilfordii]|uniref:PGG domain-containing protein n=1 Tax=Tripterygium wilfordii TaxID=458696 RepID=A0A7J7DI35_TRIWF|nr:hypothetical protein HS088_TW06G00128 [Tripterygium wilfordii]